MANGEHPRFRNPPIVEAVFDVDCDLPPRFDLAVLETAARELYEAQYPKFRIQYLQEHKIETTQDASPKMFTRLAVQALQFLHDDEKQLVQVRAQGFSFNRLAPYSSLDEYLPEIERTWRLYVGLVSPVQIRIIRLRYINRILVPMTAGAVDLDEFLTIGPRLPDEERLRLSGFLNQQAAVEKGTGHQVNLVLTAQPPESEKLPVILDITVAATTTTAESADWATILSLIGSLRSLKNRIFLNTLTVKCIELFQS
jgi:uncharacterized protein (TIGR04255 family)